MGPARLESRFSGTFYGEFVVILQDLVAQEARLPARTDIPMGSLVPVSVLR
jgi:hypothetical protein